MSGFIGPALTSPPLMCVLNLVDPVVTRHQRLAMEEFGIATDCEDPNVSPSTP